MMTNDERAAPPYLQIAGAIREKIVSGELKDGDRVPSARQIMREWGVALATANKVHSALRADGLVRAVPGVGTVVDTKGMHPHAADRSLTVVRTGKIYPDGHYARIRSVELVPAPERVADALGTAEGAIVIRRARTTYRPGDVPVATSVSWFDGALAPHAPRLLEAERIPQGTFAYVAQQTGRELAKVYTQLAASSADSAAAEQLGVAPGSPVLVSRDRFVDALGGVIEYGESTALADQWVFVESSAAKDGQ
jgi:DNA-binding GntR family transcriptional regulator